MRKNKNTSSAQNERRDVSAADIAVILLCLLGIGVCLYFFYRNLNQSLLKANETPIGTISFKYKAAQRRFTDRVVWDRIRQDSPVYMGDLIRTADLSEATVTFPSGGKISLAENSIVQVFPDRVDVTQGSVSFSAQDSDRGIVITSGGKKFNITAGSAGILTVGGDGNADIRIFNGSALAELPEGTAELRTGDALFVDSQGTALAQSLAVPLSPLPGVKVLLPPDEEADGVPSRRQMRFVWNRVGYAPGTLTRFEIAADRNFTRDAQWTDVDSSETAVPLGAGTWYWRVYPVSPEGEIAPDARDSGAQKLALVDARPPALISPPPGAALYYRTKPPEATFAWQETREASAYIIEIASDPAFAAPAVRAQTRNLSFLTSELQEGVWYWRVIPVFIGDYAGNVDASAVRSFSVERASGLDAPVLTSPQSDSFFNIAEDRQNAYFSWKRDPEADSYTIRISRNADLSAPVIAETVRDNFFSYPAYDSRLTDGAYYWGVTSTDSSGASASSPPLPFTALKSAVELRAVFPPEGYAIAEDAAADTRFSWRTNVPARMRLQVSASRDFSSPLVDEPASSESALGKALAPGTYYWRIADDTLSRFVTEPKSFAVVPPLARPVPSYPQENARIPPADAVEFRWTPVAGAQYYRFSLYDSSDAVIADRNTRDAGVTVGMAEGNYHWTVQAFSDADYSHSRRAGLVSRASFSAALPRRVALVYPQNGVTVAGFNTQKSAGVVRWESDEKLTRSRFVLSRNADPLRGTPLARVDNPPKEIRLAALAAGTYYWTITAESSGFDVSAGRVFSFTVPALPTLAAATGLKPDRTVFGIGDVQNLQRLGFSWNAVENADAYIFTLWHRSGDSLEQITQTGAQSRTAYEIDLQKLDVGAFEWQVEAVIVGANGSIERRGETASGAFAIDIPLPGELQLFDAGTLYGN